MHKSNVNIILNTDHKETFSSYVLCFSKLKEEKEAKTLNRT